jgi:hypothetical protein
MTLSVNSIIHQLISYSIKRLINSILDVPQVSLTDHSIEEDSLLSRPELQVSVQSCRLVRPDQDQPALTRTKPFVGNIRLL